MAILTVKQLEAIASPGRYNDGNGLYLEVDKSGGKIVAERQTSTN